MAISLDYQSGLENQSCLINLSKQRARMFAISVQLQRITRGSEALLLM